MIQISHICIEHIHQLCKRTRLNGIVDLSLQNQINTWDLCSNRIHMCVCVCVVMRIKDYSKHLKNGYQFYYIKGFSSLHSSNAAILSIRYLYFKCKLSQCANIDTKVRCDCISSTSIQSVLTYFSKYRQFMFRDNEFG